MAFWLIGKMTTYFPPAKHKEITGNTCFINHYIITGVNADILADAKNPF